MERKTIGSFITILRKAKGLTQKELAEQLNVSDKTVSRWERDESAPDLSLIPIIADIFDVTSDELLRGERASVKSEPEKSTAKTEKQIDYILEKNAVKFKVQSIISCGIAFLGLIAAMLFSFSFAMSEVGFFVACFFYAVAAIAEVCFAIFAFNAVKSEDFSAEKLNLHKIKLKKMCVATAIVIAALTVSSVFLPWGLFYWTFITPLVFLGVIAIFKFAEWVKAAKKAIKENRQDNPESKINLLKIKTGSITAVILAATIISHVLFFSLVSYKDLGVGTVHNSFEAFKTYMATPTEETDSYVREVYLALQNGIDDGRDYEGEWQAILGEYQHSVVLHLEEDKILYYSDINQSVMGIEFGDEEDDYRPIVTYTADQNIEGRRRLNRFHYMFAAFYAAEILTAVAVYKKRLKLFSTC